MGERSKRDTQTSRTPCHELKQTNPCHDLCCRNFLPMIAQEDLDDGLEVQAPFIDVLKRAPRGHCEYLDDATGDCAVHEKRPHVCRSYDCRDDDGRPEPLRTVFNPRTEFVTERHGDCEGCGRPLQLHYGCSGACDGHAVCIHCGAAYEVDFSYEWRRFNLRFVEGTAGLRRRYLLRSLLHRERFAEVLELAEAELRASPDDAEWLTGKGVALGELGRHEEARAVLERLAGPEAALELAWLDRAEGHPERARDRLLAAMDALAGPSQVRGMVQLGRLALQLDDLPAAASWFVRALVEGRKARPKNEMLKDRVLELVRGTPDQQAAVRSVLLGR